MNISTFAIVAWLAALSNSVPPPADPDCSRYLDAMRDPAKVATLEAWRVRIPATFDRAKYPRVHESSGFGGYSFAVDIDPATIGLRSTAHAEVRIEPGTDKVRLAAISDVLGTAFVFQFKGHEEDFEFYAMKSPRSGTVGVACRTLRGQ